MALFSLAFPEVLMPLDTGKAVLPRGTEIEHISRRGRWRDDLGRSRFIAASQLFGGRLDRLNLDLRATRRKKHQRR